VDVDFAASADTGPPSACRGVARLEAYVPSLPEDGNSRTQVPLRIGDGPRRPQSGFSTSKVSRLWFVNGTLLERKHAMN
jgi:hypothetical protein